MCVWMRHPNSYLFNPGLNTCLTCFITGSATKYILLVSTALCKIPLEHQINKFSAYLTVMIYERKYNSKLFKGIGCRLWACSLSWSSASDCQSSVQIGSLTTLWHDHIACIDDTACPTEKQHFDKWACAEPWTCPFTGCKRNDCKKHENLINCI